MTSVDSFKMYSKQVSKLMAYRFLGFVSIVMIALCFCFIMICHSLLTGSNYIDELCVDIELEKFVKENVDYFKQCVQVKLDGINYIINIKKILTELCTSFNEYEYRFAQFIKKEKYEYSSDEDELLSINNSESGSESGSEGDLIDITEECKKIKEEKIKQEAIDLTESELIESLNDEDSAEEKAEEKEPLINKEINEFIDEHTADEYDDFEVKTPDLSSSNDENDNSNESK